jgi:hypothetical protein
VPSGTAGDWRCPAPTRTWSSFQADQSSCQQYASAAIGGRTAEENAQQSAVGSAAVGTALGAAAGAIIGAATGNAARVQRGAQARDLLFGQRGRRHAAGYSYADSQRRYDMAYSQCMYARGNDLPGRVASRPAPPQASYPPPNYPAPNLSGGAPRSSQTQPAYTTYGTPPGPIAPGPAVPAPSAPPSTYPPPNTPAPPGIT